MTATSDAKLSLHDAVRLLERGCADKVRYSKQAATVAAARARVRTDGQRIEPYRCLFAGDHWHIGHPPTRKQRERLSQAFRVVRLAREEGGDFG